MGNSCRLVCHVAASTRVHAMLCCLQASVRGRLGPAASRRLSTHALKSVSAIYLLNDVSKPRDFDGAKQLNIYPHRQLINASNGSSFGVAHILHAGRSRGVSIPKAPTPSGTQAIGRLFFSSRNHVSPSSRSSKSPTSDGFETPQRESHDFAQATSAPQHNHNPKDVPGNASTSQSQADQDQIPTYSAESEILQHKEGETASEEPVSAPPGETLRVSLWELLQFIREEKFRMGAILFALLVSSGAQLLLPVAVGQLIDAVTLSPLQKQQQEQRELMQGDAFRSSQADDVLAEGQAGVAGAGPSSGEASTVESHREGAGEAEDMLGRRAFLESLGEVFKTPAARVGFCGFLGGVGAATSFMRLYLLESTIERVACRLRSSLLRQLLYQSPQASQHQKLGALVKHLSQDVVTTSRILIDLSFGLRCLTTSVVGIGLCWTIAPLSFLLSLLFPVSAAGFLLRVSGRRVSALQQQHSRALQEALQRAARALGARKQLRSLNAEAYELKAFDSALSGVYAAARKSAVAVACRNAFVFAAVSGLLVHLVYSAANLVAQGALTGGQVMSLALYSALVGTSLQGCATAWSDTSRAVAAAAEMLQHLMRGPPKALATPFNYEAERRRYEAALRHLQTGAAADAIGSNCRGPSVEFKDVWFSYPEREHHWALKGISFAIPPGAKVAILGPSGSGKSSLGSLLLCLYEPQRGAIHIGGLPIRAFDERFIRSMVVPVTQESLLVGEGSLQENVLYAQKAHQEITGETAASYSVALKAACDAACVSSFVSALPEGLKTSLGEKGAILSGKASAVANPSVAVISTERLCCAQLSGGQKQRVCLAMALYRLGQSQRSAKKAIFRGTGRDTECSEGDLPSLPTVLLLDEATSSLDAETEHQVLLNLKKLLLGETCLFISHRPGTLEISDYIAVGAALFENVAADAAKPRVELHTPIRPSPILKQDTK
ncbi:hypothetical protein Esti_000985 [Eimeria stiedai]